MSIVYSSGGHFGSCEDVDFPKVLNKTVRPGECAEKSVDLHEVLKKKARTAEISVTTGIRRRMHRGVQRDMFSRPC